jgi:hypothetical protein
VEERAQSRSSRDAREPFERDREAERAELQAADWRDHEANRRDREANRHDREANRRDREAEEREAEAGRRDSNQEHVLREMDDIENEANIACLIAGADRRDQRAEQRDRASERRDASAKGRAGDTRAAGADRANAERDRLLSGEDRDRAAEDRGDLLQVYRQRPSSNEPTEGVQGPADEEQ